MNVPRIPEPLALLTRVKKSYGNVAALNGIDLAVRDGELLALLGPNGAGKSTAIALWLGLQKPDEGDVRLFGQKPELIEARRQMGVMMQEAALQQTLRVKELLLLTASYYTSPREIGEVANMAGIASLMDRLYRNLSGGEKRKLQFALAICGNPRLLFLDEPTVGLDLEARTGMWSTLRRLIAEGCGVVLTTHYLEEAEALADRVAVLVKGQIVAQGSVSALRGVIRRSEITCVSAVSAEIIAS